MVKRRKVPLEDKTPVVVYTDKGTMENMKFVELKKKISSNTLSFRVLFIYVPNSNKYYRVEYISTQGFKLYSYDPRRRKNE